MQTIERTLTSNEVAEMVGKRHADLIRDIKTYIGYLAESKIALDDFFIESTYLDGNNRSRPNYLLTKQGCEMVSNKLTGAKGVTFTAKYVSRFNEMENHIKEHQQFNVPTSLPEALRLAAEIEEERQVLEHKVEELQPKADYYDRIMRNPGLITVSMIAKNYGMATVMFNRKLHELGIQFKQGKTWLLYKEYQNEGYTHVETYEYTTTDGLDKSRPTMKWTQKGHKFLYDVLKENDVLPLIERNKQQEVS